VSTMCQRQVASAAGRGIVGVAARAISVRVADMSNIAAAGSDSCLAKRCGMLGIADAGTAMPLHSAAS
jgi:hypothetical protein